MNLAASCLGLVRCCHKLGSSLIGSLIVGFSTSTSSFLLVRSHVISILSYDRMLRCFSLFIAVSLKYSILSCRFYSTCSLTYPHFLSFSCSPCLAILSKYQKNCWQILSCSKKHYPLICLLLKRNYQSLSAHHLCWKFIDLDHHFQVWN